MKSFSKKTLFNPNGDDRIQQRKIIGGNTTNLFNLNNVKYNWASQIYRIMMANFWVPEKVDLSVDENQYSKLTTYELEAYDGILSFLTFLDSIQTNNIPNISDWITAPEISTILAIQTYQEAIHSQSYSYIIESIIPVDKREKIYDLWREDDILLTRNRYLAQIYQDFIDSQSTDNFVRTIIANFILEGLYFYNGFIFFYSLAARNLMLGTADQIRYINRDELTHIHIFKNIMLALMEENPGIINEDVVYEMFTEAVNQEISWTNHILDNHVLGINEKSTEEYTKYLANNRLEMIGFKALYPEFTKNPYPHLEKLADSESDEMKSNFFESTVTNYNQSSSIDGWDDF